MKEERKIIFTDYETSMKDYSDLFCDIEEETGKELSDPEKWDIFCDELETWLDAEKMNLDIPTSDRIIALADLGLWHGRVQGYRLLESNVSSVFNISEDYNTYFCDKYNLRSYHVHHDGTNWIIYRVFKENLSDIQKENFLEKVYTGKATKKDITRYTRSLLPVVSAVYGW